MCFKIGGFSFQSIISFGEKKFPSGYGEAGAYEFLYIVTV